jgi:nucleoside-diphosphate-sugar epimerase
VYGSGIELTEEIAPRPRRDFLYAAHKAELEAMIEHRFPQCLRLRPHAILGPHAQPLLRFLLRLPIYPAGQCDPPQLQCIHESDVVSAIVRALRSSVAGAINLASAETFSYMQAIKHLHPRAKALPIALAQKLLTVTWRLTGFGGEPAWLDGLTQPLTLDCGRARRELGWSPAYTAFDAINATVR